MFDLTEVKFVKRIVVGSDNPNQVRTAEQIDESRALLNQCLSESPKGVIIGVEKKLHDLADRRTPSGTAVAVLPRRLSTQAGLVERTMIWPRRAGAGRSEYSFDALVQAVQGAVQHARESLRRQHEQAMFECFGSTDARRVELADNDEPSKPLVIPLWRFHQRRPMKLKAFSLELGCEIYRRRDGRMVVRVVRSRPPEKCPHRIRIEFEGADSTPGKVLLDGMLLRTLSIDAGPVSAEDA